MLLISVYGWQPQVTEEFVQDAQDAPFLYEAKAVLPLLVQIVFKSKPFGSSSFALKPLLLFLSEVRNRFPDHRKLVIITTSVLMVPRERASFWPSGDHAKLKIRSVLKSVNCLGGPPSRDWLQMFATPPRV